MNRQFPYILAAILCAVIAGRVAPSPARADALPSSTAERIYAAAKPKLLQIRTLLTATGRQSTLGSGLLVSEDGVAITNYHVVSQYALEPDSYRLEFAAPDGSKGDLKLVNFDIANDLAVVRLEGSGRPFFQFDERSVDGTMPSGERLYSMGDPLNLGFAIVEGTYNGLVERSYNDRIHFSGAINPGMSGGPTVSEDGRVAGVNVAKRLDGELVSFLVPARFVTALLDRAKSEPPLAPAAMRAEIGKQLAQWQDGLYKAFISAGYHSISLGPYQAPESSAAWFTCWGNTNSGQIPKPRAHADSVNCSSSTQLYVANDLSTGSIRIRHSYYKSTDLNAFQFSSFVSRQNPGPWVGGPGSKWLTPIRCEQELVVARPEIHPPVNLLWCARAYRDFENLFDIWVTAVTQDRDTEALVSQLDLQSISFPSAKALTKQFLDAVQWTK